jgi:muramoyltetrapeptide carboxypeptidase
MQLPHSQPILFPEALKKGDSVRFVSPGSTPDEANVARAGGRLQSWGLAVELGEHVFSKAGYLAGSDAERLSDLNEALRDPSVKAVIATRGGKGAYRIADQIDFAAARANRKFLVGFSDISILHLSLLARCGLVAIHGAPFDTDDGQSLRRALMTDASLVLNSRTREPTAKLTTRGKARGLLIGGNLDMVATAAGWSLPKLDGAILLIECVGQTIGAIDRQLSMLRKAGHLSGLKGVAVGQFTNVCADTIDMVSEHLEALDVPVLGGLPLGHGENPECVFVGAPAELDADNLRLAVSGRGA